MSLKSIEMQIALPRTMEAGKIQEQLQQRGQNMNDLAAMRNQKEAEEKRTSVIKQEQKSNVKLSQEDKDKQNSPQNNEDKERKKAKMEEMKEKHPYKGNIIDYSG